MGWQKVFGSQRWLRPGRCGLPLCNNLVAVLSTHYSYALCWLTAICQLPHEACVDAVQDMLHKYCCQTCIVYVMGSIHIQL